MTLAPQLSYDKRKNKVRALRTCRCVCRSFAAGQARRRSTPLPRRIARIDARFLLNTRINTHPKLMQIVMRIFTPSAAKELLLSPADVRRADPRTGEEVGRTIRFGVVSASWVGRCLRFGFFFWWGRGTVEGKMRRPYRTSVVGWAAAFDDSYLLTMCVCLCAPPIDSQRRRHPGRRQTGALRRQGMHACVLMCMSTGMEGKERD